MITIFTSTYNRAYILPKLYESLVKQTIKDFEWIIVDDGSKDNTEQLCNNWINDCKKFKITYLKQKNQGKHVAINTGVQIAKGDLFFIVDSDDYLSNDAIEQIEYFYKQVKDNDIFAGVSGMKAYTNGEKIGGDFPFETIDCSMIDIRNKYKIKGDMAEVFKTNILRKYPFPQFTGEKFLSEGAVWNKIGSKYLLRYFNKNIYFAEYISDGLTKNIHKKFRENPKGTMFVFMQTIRTKNVRILQKIKCSIKYWRYTILYKGTKTKDMQPFLWMYLFLPLGIILYFYDIKRK
jgi:glycosyltransferase involved in cell wall biosynthesis